MENTSPLIVVTSTDRRHLPFKVSVSRLLSNPYESTFHLSLTLLDPLSDLGMYLALEGEYLPHSCYTLKQHYYTSLRRTPPEFHRLRQPFPGHIARCLQLAHTIFRPGYFLFARRYWGNLILISSPGLIDMLKFGP